MSEQIILAIAGLIASIVTVLGAAVGALVWVIKHVFDKLIPVIERMDRNLEKNNGLVENNIDTTKELKQETRASREYLQTRNGRDGEVWKESISTLQQIQEIFAKKGI